MSLFCGGELEATNGDRGRRKRDPWPWTGQKAAAFPPCSGRRRGFTQVCH
uniref:Uncharacterized protein n=1 Tax=Arundo donax TaxID=35708 RepID=A0A0A9G7L6_ARUDO